MLYIRKKPKGFGRMAQIEGEMKEGARVLLVEDLASEGTSKINFVNAIRVAGGQIDHAFVVFDYGIFPSIVSVLGGAGMTLHGLTTWHDVLALAHERGSFTPGQYQAIKSFLDDPEAWAAPK
jgi:orotate phosphoribosyltransferase